MALLALLLYLVSLQPEICVMWLGILQTPPTSTEWDAMRSHPTQSLLPLKQWVILCKEQPGYCCSSTGRTDNITWAATFLCVGRRKWDVPLRNLQSRGSGPGNTMYIQFGFQKGSHGHVPAWRCSFHLQQCVLDLLPFFVTGEKQINIIKWGALYYTILYFNLKGFPWYTLNFQFHSFALIT